VQCESCTHTHAHTQPQIQSPLVHSPLTTYCFPLRFLRSASHARAYTQTHTQTRIQSPLVHSPLIAYCSPLAFLCRVVHTPQPLQCLPCPCLGEVGLTVNTRTTWCPLPSPRSPLPSEWRVMLIHVCLCACVCV